MIFYYTTELQSVSDTKRQEKETDTRERETLSHAKLIYTSV